MKDKRIKMANGTEWFVLAETKYNEQGYLLVCKTDDIEQIQILKHQNMDNTDLFAPENDSQILEVVCPILEKMIKEA